MTVEGWKAWLAVRLFEDQIPDQVETSFPRSTAERYSICTSTSTWISTTMTLNCHREDKGRKLNSSGSLQNSPKNRNSEYHCRDWVNDGEDYNPPAPPTTIFYSASIPAGVFGHAVTKSADGDYSLRRPSEPNRSRS